MRTNAPSRIERRAEFIAPATRVFALLCDPSLRPRLAPPSLALQFVEGPKTAIPGAIYVWKARRAGIGRRIVTQIDALTPETLVERQLEGPLPYWRHQTSVEGDGHRTSVMDVVDFVPASGMLGLILTDAAIRRDLETAFDCRDEALRRLLSEPNLPHEPTK